MTGIFTGRWKLVAAVAVTAALFAPLLVVGGTAFARSGGAAGSQYQYGPSAAQYQYKITICHFTRSRKHPAHTISISAAAWKAHVRHGDHMGPCTANETALGENVHGQSGAKHGKSGEQHGQNGQNGQNGKHDNGDDH